MEQLLPTVVEGGREEGGGVGRRGDMEGQRERGSLESVVSSCDQPSGRGTGEDCVCVCVCVCFRVLLVYVVICVCVYCCI